MRTAIGILAALVTALLLLSSAGVAHMATGGFAYDGTTGQATGTFVSFAFDEETGTITDYTLTAGTVGSQEVTVFAQIALERFADGTLDPALLETQVLVAGATWTALGAWATVRAVDNPVGNLAVANVGLLAAPGDFQGDVGEIGDMPMTGQFLEAQNTVTFALGAGLEARFEGARPEGGGGYVALTGDAFRGFLFATNGTFDLPDPTTVVVALEGPQAVFFHALPLFGMEPEEATFEQTMAEAMARGDVGMQIEIGDGGETVRSAFRTSFRMSLREATANRVSLDLTSSQTDGTIVVLAVSGDVIDLTKEIRVSLDGTDVTRVTSLELLVDAKSQGLADPQVYLLKTADGLTLSVYVPHFSTRTLTIETVLAAPGAGDLLTSPTLWIVAGVAAAVVAVAALAALRRRK
jgi:hypothetical protein